MAGSYRHIVSRNNAFLGIKHLDNMGDAYEALFECWHMIHNLSGGDKEKIRQAYIEYVKNTGGNVEYAEKHDYWK